MRVTANSYNTICMVAIYLLFMISAKYVQEVHEVIAGTSPYIVVHPDTVCTLYFPTRYPSSLKVSFDVILPYRLSFGNLLGAGYGCRQYNIPKLHEQLTFSELISCSFA